LARGVTEDDLEGKNAKFITFANVLHERSLLRQAVLGRAILSLRPRQIPG